MGYKFFACLYMLYPCNRQQTGYVLELTAEMRKVDINSYRHVSEFGLNKQRRVLLVTINEHMK